MRPVAHAFVHKGAYTAGRLNQKRRAARHFLGCADSPIALTVSVLHLGQMWVEQHLDDGVQCQIYRWAYSPRKLSRFVLHVEEAVLKTGAS